MEDLYSEIVSDGGMGNWDMMASHWGWKATQMYPPHLSVCPVRYPSSMTDELVASHKAPGRSVKLISLDNSKRALSDSFAHLTVFLSHNYPQAYSKAKLGFIIPTDITGKPGTYQYV
jgi:hypothetical protein